MPLLGKGSTISVSDGEESPTFAAIAGVDNLNLDAGQADDVDVTDWESGGYEEIIQGIKRGGNVTFSTNSLPGGAEAGTSNFDEVTTLHASGDVRAWKLEIGATPSATITFDAIVKGVAVAVPTTDKVLSSITLRITGAPTFD
jgi:hypothetical protein